MQGDKIVNRGTHEGGPNFDRLYHKLKVLSLSLLLVLCY